MGLDVRTIETDGTELVVVQRIDLDLANGDTKARELAYADNRTSEFLEWDAERIAADLEAGVDLESMFRKDELEKILKWDPPELEAGDAEKGDATVCPKCGHAF